MSLPNILRRTICPTGVRLDLSLCLTCFLLFTSEQLEGQRSSFDAVPLLLVKTSAHLLHQTVAAKISHEIIITPRPYSALLAEVFTWFASVPTERNPSHRRCATQVISETHDTNTAHHHCYSRPRDDLPLSLSLFHPFSSPRPLSSSLPPPRVVNLPLDACPPRAYSLPLPLPLPPPPLPPSSPTCSAPSAQKNWQYECNINNEVPVVRTTTRRSSSTGPGGSNYYRSTILIGQGPCTDAHV